MLSPCTLWQNGRCCHCVAHLTPNLGECAVQWKEPTTCFSSLSVKHGLQLFGPSVAADTSKWLELLSADLDDLAQSAKKVLHSLASTQCCVVADSSSAPCRRCAV